MISKKRRGSKKENIIAKWEEKIGKSPLFQNFLLR